MIMKKEKIGGVLLDYTFYDDNYHYSDGHDIEQFLLNVFKEERDIFDVLASDNRWPVLYHLSPMRQNIVLPMNLKKTDSILEVGAGMGAITASLSERVHNVECVELSQIRSLANAYRNKNRDNISIYVGSFNKVQFKKKYDIIVLIGVLEYAGMYNNDPDPFVSFLEILHDLLKKDGLLYVAIENRLGIKYLAGHPEDHWGRSYIGVEGYLSDEKGAKTFSKSEIESLLRKCGFDKFFFYYPLPDYKLPKYIYSDDYLPKNSDELSIITAYDTDSYRSFDEHIVLNSLKNTVEFKYLSNSFLIEVLKQ